MEVIHPKSSLCADTSGLSGDGIDKPGQALNAQPGVQLLGVYVGLNGPIEGWSRRDLDKTMRFCCSGHSFILIDGCHIMCF
jgi:hypothetical protein